MSTSHPSHPSRQASVPPDAPPVASEAPPIGAGAPPVAVDTPQVAAEDAPAPEAPAPRWRLALGAVALLLFGFWLGARLGPLTALGSGDSMSNGTWLPTPAPPMAYVRGAVVHPGLYPLAANARVSDLLQQAGGATRAANLAHVRLAAPVHDGDTVTVPHRRGRGCAHQ